MHTYTLPHNHDKGCVHNYYIDAWYDQSPQLPYTNPSMQTFHGQPVFPQWLIKAALIKAWHVLSRSCSPRNDCLPKAGTCYRSSQPWLNHNFLILYSIGISRYHCCWFLFLIKHDQPVSINHYLTIMADNYQGCWNKKLINLCCKSHDCLSSSTMVNINNYQQSLSTFLKIVHRLIIDSDSTIRLVFILSIVHPPLFLAIITLRPKNIMTHGKSPFNLVSMFHHKEPYKPSDEPSAY